MIVACRKILSPTHIVVLAVAFSVLVNAARAGEPEDARDDPVASQSSGDINVYLGQSVVVRAPWPVKRVSVTDPETADVQVLTPTTILLQGYAVGSTDLLLWSEDEDLWKARANVVIDLERLTAQLAMLFPESTLKVSQSDDVIVLSGMLSRANNVVQLKEFMKSTGLNYVDMTSLAGVQQVMLQVRIAEATRTSIHALGFTALVSEGSFLGALNLAEEGGTIDPISILSPFVAPEFTGSVAVTPVFLASARKDLSFFVQALATNDYLRILAEPTLVALSGQEASFLVGGEFPVPVVRATVLDKPTISIQFKEFGIRLRFRPTVLGDGTIRLLVASEVSQLSKIGAVKVEGFFVPSLVSRRAETTVELKSGQSFAMAGLISAVVQAKTSGIPGLADLPVIGALFRSIRYERAETDLVVLATVWLVEPISTVEKLTMMNDWELFVLGDVEGEGPAKISADQTEWLTAMGLHLLKGPGAWEQAEVEISGTQRATRTTNSTASVGLSP